MSLAIGLAAGLGVAGGVAGGAVAFVGDFAGGLVNVFARGNIVKETSAAKPVVVGAFLGASLGYGIGSGIEYVTADRPDAPSTIVQECYENVPEGKKVVIEQDSIGNPICTFE